MKRILFILTIALLPLSLFAQNEQAKQQRMQRMQQLQSSKIAFFTAEIQLTPKEAEEFWPLYNEYWKERDALMRKTQRAMSEIYSSVKGGVVKQGPELVKLLEAYIANSTEEGSIHRAYFDKFYKILPIEKVAKLYVAEEEFRMKMIHQLRGTGTPPPPVQK
jgi:hypothetical protein